MSVLCVQKVTWSARCGDSGVDVSHNKADKGTIDNVQRGKFKPET